MSTNHTIEEVLDHLIQECHRMAIEKGWWEGRRSVAEQIALMHSELSEALEEVRNGKAEDLVYYRADGKPEGFGVELADTVIRILDTCGRYEIPLGDLIIQKMKFNTTRPRKHGKEF